MPTGFDLDYNWLLRFMPLVCQIIGPRILTQATLQQDVFEATDLIVIEVIGFRIAVRIRRMAAQQYAHEFTLRYLRPSGIDTEWDKITAGWGNLFFYAIALKDTVVDQFFCWMLIDLARFRAHLIHQTSRRAIRFIDRWNKDGSSCFRAFDADSFPEPSIFIDRMKPQLMLGAVVHQIPKQKPSRPRQQLKFEFR